MPLVLVIASLLATTAAIAQQADPSSVPPAVTLAPPPAAGQGAPPASPSTPPPPKKDQQEAAANEILSKAPEPATNCYSGFHTSFDYDITGSALTALGRKVIEPGGLCDQYRIYAADSPFEVGVPLLPGVSVNIDKLCKMVQRPPCPEPSGEHPESQDQAKK
jgi:hypothetical protein